MWPLSKTITKINSDEFETCLKKIAELKHELEETKAKLEGEITKSNSLRGLINKKLGGEEKQETENNINPKVFLSPNGTPI